MGSICTYPGWGLRGFQRCFSSDSELWILWKSLISAENSTFQSSKISAVQCWNFQFWTAPIQRKSEMIWSETALISAGISRVLWISAEHRWKTPISETALFSAGYLWDFNPGSLCKHLSLQTGIELLRLNSLKILEPYESGSSKFER